jgi:hypothetical protein
MEHKGIRYELLETTNPSGWRWVVHWDVTQAGGFSSSKDIAIYGAKQAIEKALEANEKRTGRRSRSAPLSQFTVGTQRDRSGNKG